MSLDLVLIGGLALFGLFAGYAVFQIISLGRRRLAESSARERVESAEAGAKKIVLEAQDKAAALLADAQNEIRAGNEQLRKLEERLLRKEDILEEKNRGFEARLESIETEKRRIKEAEERLEKTREEAAKVLEKVSGMTKEEAKAALFSQLETRCREELALFLAKFEKEKKETVEKRALDIVLTALQRYARSNVADVTTTSVPLPNDDIKGKIIGREGRNIRTLERLTGVEVIIDETPESLTLSSFDPLRREVAKLAVLKLVKDGRIQPARIEEQVEEARLELEKRIGEVGEEAAYEVGIVDLPKEITYLLGRLNYRTSYGQNVLAHSVEVAHLAGMMAGELKLNVDTAKKGALLHDIGKAMDHEVQGTHIELGRKILKKCGVAEEVIKAMEAHHEDYPYATPESFIVAAADAISASRPGARRDNLENYLRRLGDLEKIASGFPGVLNTYAVSAGREIRIFVVPEKVDDFGALELARQVAAKIQSELRYPGEVKVNVIREVRAVEYAR